MRGRFAFHRHSLLHRRAKHLRGRQIARFCQFDESGLQCLINPEVNVASVITNSSPSGR